ncbi:MAG: hypothetical protein K6G33_00810 [Ruminococcus sp.]|uniref:hypothetical protein n=1 Tax=Ruminococcus sp. TaxID=41978 RepID=UPI00156890F7|nr:hypothetical protein [Ruminococcus sp.]MCR5599274.1 hypothetical protein [Ruminococcus sp.]
MTLKSAKMIYFTLLTAITVSGFITVCTLGQTVRRHNLETRLAAAAIEQEEDPLFTVRESGGRAAVFRRGAEKPYLLIDVDLRLLPDHDREMLADGIYFSSESELKRFIEDISS